MTSGARRAAPAAALSVASGLTAAVGSYQEVIPAFGNARHSADPMADE